VLGAVDILLFGRVTYQLMADYWPSPAALQDDPVIAGWMNRLPKVVFSRTLKSVEWENSRLVSDDPAQEVARLKAQPGKDMILFGSSNLSVTLAQRGLIDEYRMMVAPIFLGDGKALLHGIPERLKLKLIDTRTFDSGVVMLSYQPAAK
jgi:dihydrofolate reductase